MSRVLFTGGLGDIFAVEARMTDAEKYAVREIYLATPGAKHIKTALSYHYLWSKYPVTEILTKEQIAQHAPSKYCIHSMTELSTVCRNIGEIVPSPDTKDMSIIKIFGEIRSGQRPWNGSGFAFPRIKCDIACDFSTTSGDWRIQGRNFTEEEIKKVDQYAKNSGLKMVILGEGRTTFEEYVGYTLGSREFIGVDSAASVLAAIDKVTFPEKKIFIRSNNKAWYNHRAEWYPPAAMDFFFGQEYI